MCLENSPDLSVDSSCRGFPAVPLDFHFNPRFGERPLLSICLAPRLPVGGFFLRLPVYIPDPRFDRRFPGLAWIRDALDEPLGVQSNFLCHLQGFIAQTAFFVGLGPQCRLFFFTGNTPCPGAELNPGMLSAGITSCGFLYRPGSWRLRCLSRIDTQPSHP